MTSVNTFATLLEAYFLADTHTHTHTHTDTKALLYPCCACACWVMNRKLQPDSNVDTHHKRKPLLHNGTVTLDTDKYRLVGIPASGCEPLDVGLSRIR